MGFLDWLVKSKKSLSQMTRSELRRQELLLEKERNRLLNKGTKLAKEKQGLFERGAQEKIRSLHHSFTGWAIWTFLRVIPAC